jgi:hypothetical protein
VVRAVSGIAETVSVVAETLRVQNFGRRAPAVTIS